MEIFTPPNPFKIFSHFSKWYTLEHAKDVVSKNIICAMYALVVSPERPSPKQKPWENENLIYIGIAGGSGISYRYDSKNGANKSATQKTPVFDRTQTHWLSIFNSNPDKKTQKVHHKIISILNENPANEVWIQYITPSPDMDENIVKRLRIEVASCETSAILEYKNRWGRVPEGNKAHQSNNPRIKKGSHTDGNLKKSTLDCFFI